MRNNFKIPWLLKCFLAFIITYAVFFAKFPDYVLHPNSQSFVSNGDLLITLYDMIYHVRHDTSTTFGGMNYTDPDFLFMTDANGSFATVMRWIDNHVMDIDDYVPGIFLSTIFILIGFCGMLIFMMLKALDVSDILAFILAPIITLLCPQMARIACHLSLSFPFVIPFVMVWAARKYKVPKLEVYDLIFALVTFFFFINNAYIGFIMCMFAALIGIFSYVTDRKNKGAKMRATILISIPIILTIIVYIILKINNPYDDRVEDQWGFFHYHTQIHSFFIPKYSLQTTFYPSYAKYQKSIEWTNNLGLVPMALILSYWIYSLRNRKKANYQPLIKKSKLMVAFWWASFCMFLFAANTVIFPFKNILEPLLGPLLMFKSSGRFSWPVYFVVALFSARVLQGWIYKWKAKKSWLPIVLLIPIILFYVTEANYYLNNRYKGKDRVNYLTSEETMQQRQVFDSLGINKDNYQAIHVLPLYIGWNEKIRAGTYNRSEQGALVTSSLTGLPMLTGRLSRNSTGMTLKGTQLASHPYLKKTLLEELPNDKPILLVQGTKSDDRLSIGEQYLKKQSDLIYSCRLFELRSLPVERITRYEELKKAEDWLQQKQPEGDTTFIHYTFDDEVDSKALFGEGAHTFHEGKEQIINFTHEFEKADTLQFYAWTEITNKKYGMPEYIFLVKGEDGKETRKVDPSREHKDIYKNWIRAEYIFPVPKGKTKIRMVAKANQDIRVDEMVMAFARDTIINRYEDYTLINGYPILHNNTKNNPK